MENDEVQKVLKTEDSDTANVAQALDDFERTIWPIYESRGYDKNTALLSYSIGLLTDIYVDALADDD